MISAMNHYDSCCPFCHGPLMVFHREDGTSIDYCEWECNYNDRISEAERNEFMGKETLVMFKEQKSLLVLIFHCDSDDKIRSLGLEFYGERPCPTCGQPHHLIIEKRYCLDCFRRQVTVSKVV